MIHHTAAVSRGAQRALVVGDMPFLTFQVNVEESVRNAGRLMREGGASAVKLEGCRAVLESVRRLVEIGIPVMGHLGLLPQSVHQLGGYKQQARRPEEAHLLVEDARALEAAGAFAVVLESVPAAVAKEVTAALRIPTIGIGAGPHCDGQVLVSYDVFGLSQNVPPFVKKYAELGESMARAAREFAEDVRQGRFPAPPSGKENP
jgi:3-methyl-2-oxobutanoate hydroxymethyltransferase